MTHRAFKAGDVIAVCWSDAADDYVGHKNPESVLAQGGAVP